MGNAGKYRELQRIVIPYAELLGFADDDLKVEDDEGSKMVIDSNGNDTTGEGTNGEEVS